MGDSILPKMDKARLRSFAYQQEKYTIEIIFFSEKEIS